MIKKITTFYLCMGFLVTTAETTISANDTAPIQCPNIQTGSDAHKQILAYIEAGNLKDKKYTIGEREFEIKDDGQFFLKSIPNPAMAAVIASHETKEQQEKKVLLDGETFNYCIYRYWRKVDDKQQKYKFWAHPVKQDE